MIYSARTQIARTKESVPARCFMKDGPYENDSMTTVLDWGCGKGTDVLFFEQEGMVSHGYDPWTPEFNYSIGQATFYDYITCFYVLNVIPTKRERILCLKEAADRLGPGGQMFIAVRSGRAIDLVSKNWKKFRDGYKTSRETFQRGFTNEELKALVKAAGLCYSKQWSKAGFVGCIAL